MSERQSESNLSPSKDHGVSNGDEKPGGQLYEEKNGDKHKALIQNQIKYEKAKDVLIEWGEGGKIKSLVLSDRIYVLACITMSALALSSQNVFETLWSVLIGK